MNEVFRKRWIFKVLYLEETSSDKVISITFVSHPNCYDSFCTTSICKLEDGVISEIETLWAFQDKKVKWRVGFSHTY
ncbi:hypothetical protein [Grimontia kaedaensis]|uniref:hypothetical protein n=1 Tax=Grimontia kaedaensis TaxID=2872157 RepID=UPI002074A35E|nr:hypothetical protein [Grimontia kaedaensis]